MVPWPVGAWATEGFAQARDKTIDPATDEWWYDTLWGREVVMEWSPPLVLGQFGGWQPAIPVAIPADDFALVRVPLRWLPDAVLPGPRFRTSAMPHGDGEFAQVRTDRVFLPAGKHLDLVRGEGGWIGRYLNPDESNFFERITDDLSRSIQRIGAVIQDVVVDPVASAYEHVEAEVSRIDENVVNIVTDPGGVISDTWQRITAEINRTDENIQNILIDPVASAYEHIEAEVSRTTERVIEELNRIDDNLKYYVVHPGDAAKAIGRQLTKAAVVAIIVFPVAGIGAQVITLTLGEVAGAVSLLSPAAASAISGLTISGAGLTGVLAVSLPPRTLADIARAAVYAEGFIPILPYALEELTIQAQGSARRRDELRVQLAQLRAQVVRNGGPWLKAAQQAVHVFAGLVIAAAAIGAVTAGMFATLKSLAMMVISAAETGYHLANAREVAREIQSRMRAQNASDIAAEEEALRQIEAEIAALEAEIAAGQQATGQPTAPAPRGAGLGIGAALAAVVGLGVVLAGAKKKRRP